MSASASAPLATRDVNPSAPSSSEAKENHKSSIETEKEKPKSMDYHRQVLQSRLQEDSTKQNYISPSDTIMSPCTAKLSTYKSKHFMKAKPQQSLFAKMEASRKAGKTEEQEKREKD